MSVWKTKEGRPRPKSLYDCGLYWLSPLQETTVDVKEGRVTERAECREAH